MARKSWNQIHNMDRINLSTGETLQKSTKQVLAENIAYYRKKAGITQATLAGFLGITKNAVSNWESALSRPDIEHIPELCKVFQIQPSQLFNMRERYTKDEMDHLNDYRALDTMNRKNVRLLTKSILEVQERRKLPCPEIHPVAVAAKSVAAGIGDPYEYNMEDEEAVYVVDSEISLKADRIFKVNGNSMEPDYYDGDAVYVEFKNEIQPGQIGAFMLDNELYIKEFQKKGLVSHNRNYPIMVFSEFSEVYLVGLVLGKVDPSEYASEEQIQLYKDLKECMKA